MVAAVDPGRSKCGLVLADCSHGEIKDALVVLADDTLTQLERWHQHTPLTALVLGANRMKAAEFSFFLSIPAILGAVVLEFDAEAIASGSGGAAPYLVGALVSSAMLIGQGWIYALAFACQAVCYGLAALRWLTGERFGHAALVNVPYYFCMVNIASIVGIVQAWRGETYTTWTTARA